MSEKMHCPIYHITMRSDLCLEYQRRAGGKVKPKGSSFTTNSDGMETRWLMKYKPCLTCETGRRIRKNGAEDEDVEELIKVAGEQTKRCPKCEKHLPVSAYNRKASNKNGLQVYCKTCTARLAAESYQRKKSIDHIAPNKEPNQVKEAITEQSITKNPNYIADKPIDLIADESNMVASNPNNFPVALDDARGNRMCRICEYWQDIKTNFTHDYSVCDSCWNVAQKQISPGWKIEIEEKPILHTCRRCGQEKLEPEMFRTQQGITSVCKKCAMTKRAETIRQQQIINATVHKLPPQAVLIYFTAYPEILEALEADAKRNFRTLQNEIMFRLVSQ